MQELFGATDTAPIIRNTNLLSSAFGLNIPNSTSVDNYIHDGEIIKTEPLKAGSQVPIIAGASTCPLTPCHLTARVLGRLIDMNANKSHQLKTRARCSSRLSTVCHRTQ